MDSWNGIAHCITRYQFISVSAQIHVYSFVLLQHRRLTTAEISSIYICMYTLATNSGYIEKFLKVLFELEN
jgi:hypothetical protein